MQIDHYAFGRMTIDGKTHTSDLFIIGDRVHDGWWRKEGHVLDSDDLPAVIAAKPSLLIVGTGHSGRMVVPEVTRQRLQENNIELYAAPTGEAVRRFNERRAVLSTVAGAFHLTC